MKKRLTEKQDLSEITESQNSISDNTVSEEKSKLIELRGVSKSFDGETVLDSIDLYITGKEFITLLGPSGCGKTTTLRIIGGFEFPDVGDVFFDGVRINDIPPHKRQVNTVFQKYALFPHLNVYDNIAFGLRIAKISENEIKERVSEMLALVNLRGFEKRNVNLLSGGQQQRVAIARALINKPKVLLLDEPLGALDLKLRKDMQVELKNIQTKTGITFIYVTHDQEEALSMSDTVVVMANGKIQQIGSPTDIYNEPVNAFVADFIGESNIIDGVMLADYKVKFAGHVFECLDKGFEKNEQIDVVVRPEDVDVVAVDKGMLTGTVSSVTFKGVHYEIIVDINGFKWMIQTTDYVAPEAKIGLFIEPDAIHIMKKSEYSDMFGDYSSFSEELEHLSDITEDVEE
ncbi:MAG: ABC transporter ATP-binding protein [Ruminococcaceae bacterium]|nr:ABC transporter ATP-binding protein [Oscillospiraceae bacterium]